jgi:NitT/TauT family transport system ATP-binding protein
MMIAGLEQPTSGVVSTFGEDVARPRTEVGMIFQKDLLFDWRTAIDNVLLPFSMRGERTDPHRERARALLERVGLGGFEKHRPYQLSGGMRQRVALCRGLIQDPQLILLDEPFAALDALTKEQMQLDLQALWAGERKTAVIVTHDIAEAVFLSDRVLVMSARPSRIRADIRIDLPRPRNAQTRGSEAFAAYRSQIHLLFKQLGVFHD